MRVKRSSGGCTLRAVGSREESVRARRKPVESVLGEMALGPGCGHDFKGRGNLGGPLWKN